jgi:hypothetical protein
VLQNALRGAPTPVTKMANQFVDVEECFSQRPQRRIVGCGRGYFPKIAPATYHPPRATILFTVTLVTVSSCLGFRPGCAMYTDASTCDACPKQSDKMTR